jgi:hypothetical protein
VVDRAGGRHGRSHRAGGDRRDQVVELTERVGRGLGDHGQRRAGA